MPEQIKLLQVRNPFRRDERQISLLDYNRQTIAELCAAVVPKNVDVVVHLNGMPVEKQFWQTCWPRPGDELVIMPVLGDDEIWGAVAMIAVVVASAWLGPQVSAALVPGATTGSLLATVVTASMVLAGGMLMQAILPPPQQKSPDFDSNTSQAFGWNPATLQEENIVQPRFYGKNQLYGNVIAVHTEPDDDDATKQILKTLLALGAGPVEGIIADSIRINDQPAANFTDVTTDEKKGTLNQTHVSFFDKTKVEYHPNILVTNTGGAKVYTTPDNDFDDLEIELLFPRGIWCSYQGFLLLTPIQFKVEISEHDVGSWSTLVACTCAWATTSPIRKNFKASEEYIGGDPVTIENGKRYDIRVTKVTIDDPSPLISQEMHLGSVREVFNDQFAYPGLAILGISALATEQLYGSLQVSCIQQGRIVNVYNGSTWSLEYSTNPAWVLWDILTQPVISGDGGGTAYAIERYECMDPSRLDLVKFYELAQYCDQSVDDGEGSTEKRVTFNGGFDTGTSVWEAALKVCEIARCTLVWDGIKLTLAIDKAADPVQMFCVGNIAAGNFCRTYLPQSERASEIEVHYRDELLDFQRTAFTIFDDEINNPNSKLTLELFGIIKQSEAWRAGQLRLAENRLLTDIVEFGADIDAIASTVGDVIYLQHDVPDWQCGGRVVSASSNSITIDKPVTPSGDTDKVMVRVYDPGTKQEAIEDHTVSTVSDDGLTITITDTWTIQPSRADVFIFGPTATYKRKYRLTNIRKTVQQRYTLTASEYNAAKYDGDSGTPPIPIPGHQSPKAAERVVVHPRSPQELWNEYPKSTTVEPPVLSVPILAGIDWLEKPNDKIGWTAGVVTYKGQNHEITAEATGLAAKYIYWNQDKTETFLGTNTLSEAMGPNKWIVCVNEGGTAHPIGSGKPYWGEMITVETLAAITAQLGNVFSGSVTGATITGGLIRTAESGRAVIIDANGIKFVSDDVMTGKYGQFKYGQAKYGTGYLARFCNTDAAGLPFEVQQEQTVGDMRLYNRSSVPSGAAKVGDFCVVNGVLKECYNAGTPGSWRSVNRLTVEEIDGTPSVDDVIKIKVANGDLTDDGGGVITIAT